MLAAWTRANSLMVHLCDLQVARQVEAGLVETAEQVGDDGEGVDLVETGLVVEDEAMVQYRRRHGLDVLEADGRPARQQRHAARRLGQGDGRTRRGAVGDVLLDP